VNEFSGWLKFVNAWPSWLRWVLLLPVSVATTLAWWLLVALIGISVGLFADDEVRSTLGFFRMAMETALSMVFVLAGVYVAPAARLLVAAILGLLVLLGAAALWSSSFAETHDSFRLAAVELAVGILVAWVWVGRDIAKARGDLAK
jgi:hypothetical protein